MNAKIGERPMEKRKKIILLVVGVSITLLALIGASFAYFTANIKTDDGEAIIGKAITTVNVNMEYGGVINSEGMYPGHKVVKTIHVTGSGEANAVPANVTLTLTPKVSDFPNHVRYTIYAVENSKIEINSICGTSQNEAKEGKYYDNMECDTSELGEELKTGIFINKQVETLDISVEYNTDRTYYVIVEYINDLATNQNKEQGKTFTINLGYVGEKKPTATIMTRSNTAFWQDNYRTYITKIVIEPSLSQKENVSETFDVSESQDKSVMAYLVPNEGDTTKYTLYLQGENGILANSDSSNLFSNFTNVTTIEGLKYLDTSNVTNMSYMFSRCRSLTNIDVSHFDTSDVTDMSSMFSNCKSLTSIDVSHFKTSHVTNMNQIFSSCSSLTNLDVSHFDTSDVTNMSSMFSNCRSLTSIDVSHFNTSNITDMDYMFANCSSLTSIDVSHFNTSNVKNMYYMFSSCSGLASLDLSHFNTSNVMYRNNMFYNLPSNAIIKVRNAEEQKKILAFSYSNDRPASWTEENVVIAE